MPTVCNTPKPPPVIDPQGLKAHGAQVDNASKLPNRGGGSAPLSDQNRYLGFENSESKSNVTPMVLTCPLLSFR